MKKKGNVVKKVAGHPYAPRQGEVPMEKVINEFRVIETDDGFRIEIKGDKEAIRHMLHSFGPHGFHHRKRPRGHGFGFGFGPRFWADFGDWCGPWGEWTWEEEAAAGEEDEPKTA
jgi:hypothetical protein